MRMTLPSSITVQVEGDLAENKKKDETARETAIQVSWALCIFLRHSLVRETSLITLHL